MNPRRKIVAFAFLVFTAFSISISWTGSKGISDALAMPVPQRMELPNGLVVIVLEEHSLPFVTFKLLVDAGSRRDPSGEKGLANMTSKALLLGTSERSATTMNEELDAMGSTLNASCSQDFAGIGLRALKKDMDRGFNIFMEALTRPAFPADEIQRQIEAIAGEIRSSEDQPLEVAQKAFRKALFLDSPYGYPVKGTEESVRGITREAVVEFYNAYYHPNISILVIAGDITADEVKTRLSPRIGSWQFQEVPQVPFVTTFAKGPSTTKIDRPATQAGIIIGHAGIERTNRDYHALSVMSYILGGGSFSSRLMEEIRVKRGLAYAVDSSFVYRKYPGSFEIELQTKNSSVQEAIALAIRQMERMQQEPVSDEELQTAKKYLIGSFPLRFSTQEALTELFAHIEYYGLGMDYPQKYPSLIEAITREDVQLVAKAYLHPEDCLVVIVGDFKEKDGKERMEEGQKGDTR